MADNDVSPDPRIEFSAKMLKAKFVPVFKRLVDKLFETARKTGGPRLTPDGAMSELDDVLEAMLQAVAQALEERDRSHRQPSSLLKIDSVAVREEIHHYAVGAFYRTYFPRKAGLEGKPRRGATRLPLEYLDQVLKLSMRGMNPAAIAKVLGQSDPKASDRIGKQIRIAVKRIGKTSRENEKSSPK